MKKFLAILLAGAMIFALGACGNTDQGADGGQQAADPDWYKALVGDESVKAEFPYYALVDIDQDGINEVIVSSTENANVAAEDKAQLVAFVNGEITVLKEIGGVAGESFSYDEANKALYYYSRLSGEEHITQYALENGALAEMLTADRYAQHHGPVDKDEESFYLNGEEAAQADAQAVWDLYNALERITYAAE